MGLINQLIRSLRNVVNNIFGFLLRKKRKRGSREEPIVVPKSWGKKEESMTHRAIELPRIKYKRKLPGLRQLNRILAGFLLVINFVFSQFLLGSVGAAAQPVFLIFMGNCYIIIKYLWLSRKKED